MPITRHGYAPPRQPHAKRYPNTHRKTRAYLAARLAAGHVFDCARCGQTIRHGDDWHLDHAPDRTGYLGPSHATCNLKAGNT